MSHGTDRMLGQSQLKPAKCGFESSKKPQWSKSQLDSSKVIDWEAFHHRSRRRHSSKLQIRNAGGAGSLSKKGPKKNRRGGGEEVGILPLTGVHSLCAISCKVFTAQSPPNGLKGNVQGMPMFCSCLDSLIRGMLPCDQYLEGITEFIWTLLLRTCLT